MASLLCPSCTAMHGCLWSTGHASVSGMSKSTGTSIAAPAEGHIWEQQIEPCTAQCTLGSLVTLSDLRFSSLSHCHRHLLAYMPTCMTLSVSMYIRIPLGIWHSTLIDCINIWGWSCRHLHAAQCCMCHARPGSGRLHALSVQKAAMRAKNGWLHPASIRGPTVC